MRTFKDILKLSLPSLMLLSSSVVFGQEQGSDSSQFHIIPETVMPGFCRNNAEGNTEAIFLDAHNGVTLWRNNSPDTSQSNASTLMYEPYASQLASLTFSLKQHTFDRDTRMLPGVLTFNDMSQNVILDIEVKDSISKAGKSDEIQLIGTLSLQPATSTETNTAQHQDTGLNFCVAMQARSNKASDSYAMKQMMFSTK